MVLKRRIAAAAITVLIGFSTQPCVAKQPNVLLIVVDDLNDWVGCLGGHPQAQTPHIDRLAERGFLFTNAHCNAPACNPSRASLLTGRFPHSIGVYHNGDPAQDAYAQHTTLHEHFKQHGYYILGAGKIGHGPNAPLWDEYYKKPRTGKPRGLRSNANRAPEGGAAWDVGDDETGDGLVAAWAAQQLARKHDEPFFLSVGFAKPHRPLVAPTADFELFPADQVQLPLVRDDDLDDLPQAGRLVAYNRWKHRTAKLGTDHDQVLRGGHWRDNARAYLACVSFVDRQIGRVIEALDEGPHAGDTIVMFFSDHGFHLGEKRHWTKFTLWEDATRVPMIMAGVGVTRPGASTDEPVGLIDVYPTLVDLCGLPRPEHLEGESVRTLLDNQQATRGRPAITSYGRGNMALRSRDWRYIRYEDGSEELYDHRIDPHEWNNLAGDSQNAHIKRELSRRFPADEAPSTSPQPFKVLDEAQHTSDSKSPHSEGALQADGDANGDGTVDGNDFLIWQANFQRAGGGGDFPINGLILDPIAAAGGGSSAVPEPVSSGLLAVAGMLLVGFRRTRGA